MTVRQVVGAWVIRTMDRLGWVPKRKYENLQKITCGDIVINAAVPVQMRVVGRETRWLCSWGQVLYFVSRGCNDGGCTGCPNEM